MYLAKDCKRYDAKIIRSALRSVKISFSAWQYGAMKESMSEEETDLLSTNIEMETNTI